ncbi:hypothetical protein N0V83_008126 [Neocucurbitaria cava]|uniref:Glucose-methanol-choline oxidoreductase N-terminal domain-containing protein n=1 Tax=Neocucurbitaria cava TaxID=798079 RepID=A0A9W8Y638_9PLEO|nr:hypothetical protein N0V83_008126 [Neocucurbitaria cava]
MSTAGCVIARRLAEDSNTSVLVLEAGRPKEEVPASAIPAGVSQILGTDADWNIQSEPCVELNNRQLHLGRGKFVGGSSGCNGTLCIRGTPQDYDDWAVEGWSGADMFAYMRKAEHFHNKDWFEATNNEHGHGGPLATAPHDLAPISSRVLDSFQSKGLPLRPDMFTTGDAAQGCGHAVRTIIKGVRTTSYDYIGSDHSYPNIKVMTGQHVDKIVLEARGSDLVAAGVEVRQADGQKSYLKAEKEVILASGAYGSPAVLLRSGIGPKSELEELGIPVQVDLPGVGKNLMDHLVSFTSKPIAEVIANSLICRSYSTSTKCHRLA